MAIAYTPPGVSVQELTTTSLTPLLAIPGAVCLVGLAQGFIQQTDEIQLVGTTATVLPRVPSNATMASNAIVSIIDATNPANAPNGYQPSTDYTFSNTNHTITRVVTTNTLASNVSAGANSFTLSAGPVPAAGQVVRLTHTGGTPTEIATVSSVAGQVVTLTTNLVNNYSSADVVSWGNIPDSEFVYVTYQYTPVDYFQPIRLNSMADIQNRFGSAWDPTNTVINSPLSFAASLAFQNGASNVVLQPLFNLSGTQASASDNANPTVWSNVFTTNLLVLQDINIIVSVVGQSQTGVTDSIRLQIEQATQDLIYQMNQEQLRAVAIMGEDSTTSTSGSPKAQDATLISHANTLASRYNNAVTQQLVFVNTASFNVPNVTGSLAVGGQYMAAAVAGMLASQSPAATLTREVIAGFTAINDTRSLSQMNNDASNGLLVIVAQGNTLLVRHGITLDSTNVATSELNVVRAKHFLIESLSQTLNNQVIGKVIADQNAPTTVNNLVIATLEDLKGLGYISDYDNVASRITSINPTQMAVTFDYLPAFIVNYVNVAFTVDLTNQTLTVSAQGAAG